MALPVGKDSGSFFPGALRERGYIEGQNIRFELRSDEGELRRLPELAAELVRLKVDVIVTWFTPTATAAKQATREIPIVCALCGDMIGTGLAESLAAGRKCHWQHEPSGGTAKLSN
jgi:putative ABC transport system substrate-binding protein